MSNEETPLSPNAVKEAAVNKLQGMLPPGKTKGSHPRRAAIPEEEKKRAGKQTSISIRMKVLHIDDFIAIRDDPSIRFPYAEFFKKTRKGAYMGCFTKNDGTGWIKKCEDR